MALTLISTHTASASATLDITSGIDGTYDSYEFHCVNMHPATSEVRFQFQVNAADATGFNETITSTFFRAYHLESGSAAGLDYRTAYDQAQGTAYQDISENVSGESGFDDASASGVLTLYSPASTTYVKHFTARVNQMAGNPVTVDSFAAGYINVTAAIDEISFKFHSGNIDAGTIKMFGVS
jgi:hypothetical protein|tara:strand:- start:3 stop:548 length:546 start_codon:yes stop_codon:yes gene_type:complete